LSEGTAQGSVEAECLKAHLDVDESSNGLADKLFRGEGE
jgi:hypothetical protein